MSFRVMPLGEFMRQISVKNYLTIGRLMQFILDYAKDRDGTTELGKSGRKVVLERLVEMHDALAELDMEHSCAQAAYVGGLLQSNTTMARLADAVGQLAVTVLSEMSDLFVGYIPADHAKVWNIKKPFGQAVYINFPSARVDATGAGNCFAVEQYSACVFHLMRVVEKALRALARERKIKMIANAPIEWADWGKILGVLEAEAEKINKTWPRGKRKDAALDFYRGVVGELYSFKDCYRNYVTHDRMDYDAHQAASAYHRVSEFMRRLAVHLSETQKGPITWPKK
jgi:hypothetical protein